MEKIVLLQPQPCKGWWGRDFVSVVGFGKTPSCLKNQTGAKLQVGELLSKQTLRPLTDVAARCLPSASADHVDAGSQLREGLRGMNSVCWQPQPHMENVIAINPRTL